MKAMYFCKVGVNTLYEDDFPWREIKVTPHQQKYASLVEGNLFNAPEEGYYVFNFVFLKPPTSFESLFKNCTSLVGLNLSNFNTQNVTDMDSMFNGCSSLTNLNLSNFNTQNVKNKDNIFYNCFSLIPSKIIKCIKNLV